MENSTVESSVNCWHEFISKYLPLGRHRWPAACRWISLFVGAFGMATAVLSATSSVWQNALRAIMNQTETESNVMVQVGNVGAMLAFPAGMTYEHFGSQTASLVGGIFSVATFLLFYLGTSYWASFFAVNQWLVCILWFINGFASSFTYMAALMPNAHNFPFHQRGKVIGFLDASLSLGPTIFSVIYNTAFTNGFIKPGEEGKQNLPGFFLLISLTYAIVSLLMVLFIGRLPSGSKKEPSTENFQSDVAEIVENKEVTGNDDEPSSTNLNKDLIVATGSLIREEKPPNQFAEFPFAELSITKVIKRWNFYFFLGQLVLMSSAQLVYVTNIATYLRSFNMNEYNLLFTVLNSLLASCSKLAAGIVSDLVAKDGRMPRAVVFLIPYALQTLALFLSIFVGDNFIVMLLTCICLGLSTGATWCQSPTILGELFGGKYLASNWGWSSLVMGALGFPYAIAFSSIYEAAIYQPGEIYCYGLECFTWSFALLAGTSLCGFIMALGLAQNMLQNAACRRIDKTTTEVNDNL